MAFTSYLLLMVPVILAFGVLYYIDEDIKRRVNNGLLEAVIEILISLLILFFGLGFAFSVLT